MASMFGGQASANMVTSAIDAYSAVSRVQGEKQDRELRAKEAEQLAKLREQQLRSTTAAADIDESKSEAFKILNEEVTTLKKKLNRQEGNTGKQILASVVSAKDLPAQREALRRAKVEMPDTVKDAFGIQNIDTVSLLSTNDIQEAKGYLAGMPGINPEALTDEAVQKVIDTGMLVKADGKIADLSALSISAGSWDFMTQEQRDVFEAKADSIKDILTITAPDSKSDPYVPASEQDIASTRSALEGKASTLLGLNPKDNSPTLAKELEYLKNAFPDEDPVEVYKELKRSTGSGGSVDERLIQYKQKLLKDKGYEPGSKEYEQGINKLLEEIIVQKTAGSSSNKALNDSEIAMNAEEVGAAILDTKDEAGIYPTNNQSQLLEKRFMNTPQFKTSNLNKEFADFKAQVGSANKVLELSQKIDAYIAEGGNLGIEKSFTTAVMSKLPQTLKGLTADYVSEASAEDIALSMGIKGEATLIIGEMVKAMYGGQASNRDREVFESVIRSGSWDNNFGIKTSLNNMADVVVKSANGAGENLIRSGLTHTPAQYLNDLNAKVNKPTSNAPSKPKVKTEADLPALSSEELQSGWRHAQQDGIWYKINPNTKEYKAL